MRNRFLLFGGLIISACIFIGCKKKSDPAIPAQPHAESSAPDALPFSIELRHFYTGGWHADRPQEWLYEDFHGEQVIDGLPFKVDGYCEAYGKRNLQWHQGQDLPLDLVGIRVGRAFDELHLIHEARFRETAGCIIANLRLNYADGSHADLPIQYGYQVLDVSRLLPEETEVIADPQTKIIWRGKKLTSFDVNRRLTKSLLVNPHPEKLVQTMDVLNAHTRASYVLAAATVARRAAASRTVTAGLPLNVPARHYDGTLTIRVVDDLTGLPIANADCEPGMQINQANTVGDPVLSDINGNAVFKYPTAQTTNIYVIVGRPDYEQQSQSWQAGLIPRTNIFRLSKKQ